MNQKIVRPFLFICLTMLFPSIITAKYIDITKELKQILKSDNYEKVTQKIEKLKNKLNKKTEYTYKWGAGFKNDFLSNYQGEIIYLAAATLVRRHKIKLIKHKEKIIFYELIEIRLTGLEAYGDPDSEFIRKKKSNSKSIQQLKTDYFKIYESDFDLIGIFDFKFLYGKDCIEGKGDIKERLDFEKFIQQKNKEEVLKCLKSTILAKQTYGIEGVHRLSKKGLVFDKKALEIIELITLKKEKVNVCTGCMGISLTIKEVIKRIERDYK